MMQHRRFTILPAVLILLALAMSACAANAPAYAPESQPTATTTPIPPTETPMPIVDLEGTYWVLVSYIDDQGKTTTVLPNTIINAEFTADQIVGTAGCNRYFAPYDSENNTLTVGPVGATKMACGETVDKQEFHYVVALESVTAYGIVGDELHLVDAEGTTVLVFAKAEPDAVSAPEWTAETLKNATYTLDDLGDVPLVNGDYENKYGDGASMRNKVGINNVALGDLDGDGDDDAAVILWWESGGSGIFLYLAAVYNDNGTPRQTGMIALGDRVQPGALSIDGGTIVLDLLTHAPGDPLCCASQETVQTYAMEGDSLVLVSEEISAPELTSVVWAWVRFDSADGAHDITVDDPARYTIEFLADGTYRLRADCNQGSGSYTLDSSSLTLQPGPMTLVACADGSLDSDYLTHLGDVTTFVLESKNLKLNLAADAGSMVFAKAD